MKTKKLTKIAGVITLLACIWGGVSCEQNLPEETYTVTFDSDGGSEIKPVTVKDGEKVTKPEADPTKDGYTFKGWFNGETEYDFEASVTANITLKAKWEAGTYTVTFDSDGGSVVESAVVKDGAKVTKPADPTKTGYTFKGWFNGETVYDFETAVTANITLKANWEVVTYNITYELNGGTGDEGNPKTYTIETADFTIKNLVSGPAATPNFVGWYSDKDLTKPAVTTITKGSTGDLSFYAKWSAKSTFTVTFNFVGVEESASATVEDGEALTSEQLESVKSKISSDYEFVNFYTNQECTTEFDVKQTFTSNFTLYVKVNEIKKFTVTFDSNDGSEIKTVTVKDGEKVPKPADPTKTGYTFKGWLNGETEYDFEKSVTSNITLEAKWEENTYTVTFDSGVTSQTIKYNGTATEPTAPTKDGYDFVGWYEGDTKFDFATKITKNISLTAKWEDPTKVALATILEFNKEYTGYLEFTYGDVASGEGWQNVSASEIYLNLPKDSLVENGTVKVVYSISGISENATSVTTQGVFDNWGWKDTIYSTADGTEIVKTWTITAEGITKMADSDYASFKIVPQYGNADCANFVGTKIKVVVSNLKVTYTPPRTLVADGEPVEIEFDQWGNMVESAFEGYSDDDVLILTYSIEGSVEGVVGWGCGKISSYGDSTQGKAIPVQQLGENVFKISYADFKDWLPIKHPQYDIGGLNWNMYKQGDATPTRVSAKMQKMKVQE